MNERESNRGLDAGAQALADALDLSFRLLRWAIGGLFVIYLLSGLFVVRQHERAFVLVLGRVRGMGEERVLGPGLHWALPRPFAEVHRVDTERVRVVETFPPPPPRSPDAPPPAVPWDEYLLTADANLVRAVWAARYTIADPAAWRFDHADGEAVIHNELHRAVLQTTARFGVDAVLRTDIESVREGIEATLRRRIEALGLGARLERVDLIAMMPPPPVAEAFDEGIRAEQDRSRLISEARAYAARLEQETVGEAARRIAEAEAWQRRFVAEVAAEAAYFTAVLPQYRTQPEVVAETLHQDVIRQVFERAAGVYYLRSATNGSQELRLWLGPRSPALRGPRAEEER